MTEIKGCPGYFVNELGEVFSFKSGALRVMKQRVNNHGYKQVSLCIDGKKKNKFVHRLVASTFLANQHNKSCVNHLNGDRKYNAVSNLEWVTHSENVYHSYEKLGRKAWHKNKTLEYIPRKNNKLLTYQGRTQCISRWAKELGISRQLLAARLGKLGWTVQKALTTPSHNSA